MWLSLILSFGSIFRDWRMAGRVGAWSTSSRLLKPSRLPVPEWAQLSTELQPRFWRGGLHKIEESAGRGTSIRLLPFAFLGFKPLLSGLPHFRGNGAGREPVSREREVSRQVRPRCARGAHAIRYRHRRPRARPRRACRGQRDRYRYLGITRRMLEQSRPPSRRTHSGSHGGQKQTVDTPSRRAHLFNSLSWFAPALLWFARARLSEFLLWPSDLLQRPGSLLKSAHFLKQSLSVYIATIAASAPTVELRWGAGRRSVPSFKSRQHF
jgi:hypothetical protein